MNKTSGFRTIQFKDAICEYKDIGFSESEYCDSGTVYMTKYNSTRLITPINTNRKCQKCNGTGTIEKAEYEIEKSNN